jgi:hypothetical protein
MVEMSVSARFSDNLWCGSWDLMFGSSVGLVGCRSEVVWLLSESGWWAETAMAAALKVDGGRVFFLLFFFSKPKVLKKGI